MKYVSIFIILIIFANPTYSRKIGETEITAEDGIEVFQKEKFYLLNKNVKIISDSFTLSGDKIKIFFEKDLYDIKIIDAFGNVKLNSIQNNLNASGERLEFKADIEEIFISGIESKLVTDETKMISNGSIKVNNISGKFFIEGEQSSLNAQEIFIEGEYIDGMFSKSTDKRDIQILKVSDPNISYVKMENTEMYAKKINYNKDTAIVEMENSVKIIRDGETITGDYGTLDTNKNSYKVKSKEEKKVKVIIINQDE